MIVSSEKVKGKFEQKKIHALGVLAFASVFMTIPSQANSVRHLDTLSSAEASPD
ncbi:MAG: hypothetical protein IPL46_21670 [Saprospiraceae bacterium]|nr:hypothetical protein [Saprospiraceae bacterium]